MRVNIYPNHDGTSDIYNYDTGVKMYTVIDDDIDGVLFDLSAE